MDPSRNKPSQISEDNEIAQCVGGEHLAPSRSQEITAVLLSDSEPSSVDTKDRVPSRKEDGAGPDVVEMLAETLEVLGQCHLPAVCDTQQARLQDPRREGREIRVQRH